MPPLNKFVFPDLEYHVWKIGPDHAGRPYVNLEAPFESVRHWVYSEPYDSMTQAGWQRDVSEKHVRDLAKEMLGDTFTPTNWTASADEWHLKNRVMHDKAEGRVQYVDLHVHRAHKLRLTDGNHRFEAMNHLLADAISRGDARLRDQIKAAPVSLKILMSPQHLHADFLHLQMGKSVPLSLTKSIEMAHGDMTPEKRRVMEFAWKTALLLHKDERSHLYLKVAFDTRKGEFPIQVSSLAADHASSMATTLFGGAVIALRFGKSPEWMAERYVDVFTTLKGYESGLLYEAGRKLAPKGFGGSKSGTHMLIGLGNVLAWRLIREGRDGDGPIDPKMRDDFSYVACAMFEKGTSKGAATEKREDMHRFCRQYFKDLKGVEMIEGVPVDLVLATSASTWGLDAKGWRAWKKENADYVAAFEAEDEGEAEGPAEDVDAEADGEDDTKKPAVAKAEGGSR